MKKKFLAIVFVFLMSLIMGVRPNFAHNDSTEMSLLAQQGSGVRTLQHAQTGKLTYIGVDSTHSFRGFAAATARPNEGNAMSAIVAFAPDFGLNDARTELRFDRGNGRSYRFQQVYNGVPIYGGQMIVSYNVNSRLSAIIGEVSPGLTISTTPTIASSNAAQNALAHVEKIEGTNLLAASAPELWIFDERLLQPSTAPAELVWRVEVTSTDRKPIRYEVLVNASRGGITLSYNKVSEFVSEESMAYIREHGNPNARTTPDVPATYPMLPNHVFSGITYDSNETTDRQGTGSSVLVCNDVPTGVVNASSDTCDEDPDGTTTLPLDANAAHFFAFAIANYYDAHYGRNSIDDAGLPLISNINFSETLGVPYQNAFWDGTQMTYGNADEEGNFGGFWPAEDVVGHELSHGVTEYSSNLFYFYESGAINEAMSDIFGELMDLEIPFDSFGNPESDADRWYMGEDLSIGAIRNMQYPEMGLPPQPDRMTSPYYFRGSGDNGGVHYNSGVANKAVYLLTDGDTFNGQTINPIGPNKTGRVFYDVNQILPSGADHQLLGVLLQQACDDAIGGPDGITTADCAEVAKTVLATEMHLDNSSYFTPEAPDPTTTAACPNGETPDSIFTQPFDTDNPLSFTAEILFDENGTWAYPWQPWGQTTFNVYGTSYDPNDLGGDSVYGSDSEAALDSTYRTASPVQLFGGTSYYLFFRHSYGFERGSTVFYDGAVVEYSVDGVNWQDLGPLFEDGRGYSGTIYPFFGNPLGGRDGFVGRSNGFVSSRYDLTALAGSSFSFRFRSGMDEFFPGGWDYGWFVDDVVIYSCGVNTDDAGPSVTDVSVNYGPTIDVDVTFSEAVGVATGWYTLTGCIPSSEVVSGGPITYTISLDGVGYSEKCTLDIVEANVTDDDTEDTPPSGDVLAPFDPVTFNAAIESDNPIVLATAGWVLDSPFAGYSGNAALFTADPADTLTLLFDGTYVDVIYADFAPGVFAIEVDNVVLRTVTTDGFGGPGLVANVNYLDDEPHVLRVYPVSGFAIIDAFLADLIGNTNPLTIPVLVTPADSSVQDASPTFTWNPVTDAELYRLFVQDDTSPTAVTVIDEWYNAADICATTCEVTPSVALLTDNYTWTVVAANGGGVSVAATPIAFSTVVNAGETALDTPDSVTHETQPFFSWAESPTATYYRLEVKDNGGVVLYDNWFTAASVCLGGGVCGVQLPIEIGIVGTNAFTWSIQTYTGVLGPITGPQAFTTDGPDTLAPTGTVSAPDGYPIFEWEYISGIEFYNVVVLNTATSAVVYNDFAEDAVCIADSCQFLLPFGLSAGNYTWYVRGYSDATRAFTPWISATFTLSVPAAPDVPLPGTPDYIVTVEKPSFTWNVVNGASAYELTLLGPVAFTQIFQWYDGCNIDFCSVVSPVALVEGEYDWYLRAIGPGGVSDYSDINGSAAPVYKPREFTVDFGAVRTPTALVPSGTITSPDPTYTWSRGSSNNATYYQLIIQNGVDGGILFDQWFEAVSPNCTSSTCTVSLGPVLPANGPYIMWVRGYGLDGYGQWTSSSFTLNMAFAPIKPIVYQPVSGTTFTTVDTFNFQWLHVGDASYYHLVVNKTSAPTAVVFDSWLRAKSIGCTTVCNYVIPTSFTNGSYSWSVEAYNQTGTRVSNTSTFTVDGDVPAVPTVVSPSQGENVTTTNSPSLQWKHVTGATRYQVYLYNKLTATVLINAVTYNVGSPELFCITSADCILDAGLLLTDTGTSVGGYEWYVKAFGPGGESDWSTKFVFDVELPAPAAPVLDEPFDAYLFSPTEFSWSTVANADYYYLSVKDAAGVQVFGQWYLEADFCTLSVCEVDVTTTFAVGGYTWTVQSWGHGEYGGTSAPLFFRRLK